nr:immunoglobulin heavy chain junction region [Macaca mulatta]MOY17973.1 immunoglobulin heavy chain junction region [Macaca mulatta]MOY18006.1 immunoglobulin heavy chain junction region [Macaca mulatta]MOY18047.1 immunoglobulin heavy chain junction region [Macaca mulatta]MOY18075.1 immunoglobulin heavy chain junction region [Macaca mulatta]
CAREGEFDSLDVW